MQRRRAEPGAQPLREEVDLEEQQRRVDQKKRAKRQAKCCKPSTALLWVIAFSTIVTMIIMVAVVASIYGTAGKVQQMITTAEVMVAQVNNSGITEVVFQLGTQWQAAGLTNSSLAAISKALGATEIVTGVIADIEPALVKQLANRTMITVLGLLGLAENIIATQHLNFEIPLGPG